ncbi:MAG: DUF4410 domain-containing protein [Deltaproteobacteria bacterium]|jgi:hypothetical protein|nr:DUF4410 domain-containing protein [Deltaproteobacteria bacterium]
MKKCVFIFLLTFFVFAGCSTKSSYIPTPDAVKIEPGAKFSVGEITDNSGFKFPPGETETVDLKTAMADALRKALLAKGIYEEGQWVVTVQILEYSPGNAFARWLLPGAGATKLKVVAHVLSQDGTRSAQIPVERFIGFGGAYTVGAWKYVFDEVALEMVNVLSSSR